MTTRSLSTLILPLFVSSLLSSPVHSAPLKTPRLDPSEIASRALPSVVSISTTRDGEGAENRSVGVGSGVILRSDGLIVTSHHVIDGSKRVRVTLQGGGAPLDARILATDPRSDIALLRLEKGAPAPLPVLPLGDSDSVKVGDPAIAVGNPFGFNHTVTSGIISARGRPGAAMGPFGDPGPDVDDMLQTDAAINPGNSGGPLLDAGGRMIGLNAAIFSQNGAFIGIGFAIPSRVVQEITDQLLKNGRVVRGWLGVTAQSLDERLAAKFKTTPQGALVSDLRQNGPAQKAGLRVGDVVKRFDQQPIKDSLDLKQRATAATVGKSVEIEAVRNGQKIVQTLLIGEQPKADFDESQSTALSQLPGKAAKKPFRAAKDLGLALQDVPSDLRGMMGLASREGVLVGQVTPGSVAEEAGIGSGDVLLAIERAPVSTSHEASMQIQRQLKKAAHGDHLLLLVQRGPEDRIFLVLPTQE